MFQEKNIIYHSSKFKLILENWMIFAIPNWNPLF